MSFSPVSTLLFDLGGVLYNINVQRTRDSLSLLAQHPIDYSLSSQDDVFSEYESGKLTSAEFRQALRNIYSIAAEDEEIDAAWNALLIGVFPGRAELLRLLRQRYRLALLSNINEIHHRYIAEQCRELFGELDHVFLSYQVGMRKPNADIYHHVLQELGAQPQEVLFFDDSPLNIYTAGQLGIATHHVTQNSPLEQRLGSL